MVNNAKLKSYLQELAQSTSQFYQENLAPEQLNQYPEQIRFIGLMRLDPKVRKNPLFTRCVGLMDKDPRFTALEGKLVGTSDSASIVQSNESVILSFLQQLYVRNPTYDQAIFDKFYFAFEELFYRETFRIRDLSRLNNFNSTSNLIELGEGIQIRKDPLQRVINTTSEAMKSWAFPEHYLSDYVIERLYERKKIIMDSKRQSNEEVDKGQRLLNENNDHARGLPKTLELFDLVISALRTLKSSAVFRDFNTSSELLSFHPMPTTGTSYTMPLSRTILSGEQCLMEESDIPELKKIFRFLNTEKDSRFNVAQRRLSLGSERASLEDRLLDYIIGLEALYLPDGNQELVFRLSLRASLLLCSEPAQRKATYYFLKNIYETRSKIVHGSKYDLVKTEIDELEKLLRKSLKLWLEDKTQFSTNQYSNTGKLINEGLLSTIFF